MFAIKKINKKKTNHPAIFSLSYKTNVNFFSLKFAANLNFSLILSSISIVLYGIFRS